MHKVVSSASNNLQALLEEAKKLYQEQKYPEAAEKYKAAILQVPDSAAAWANLGTALRKTGHIDAALACTEKALAIRPHDPGFLTNLGNVFTDLDRMNDALRAHEEAYQARPDDFLVRKNYATSLREFGQFELALTHFDAVCAMQPQNGPLRFDRATVKLALGRFKQGWQDFEMRWSLNEAQLRPSDAPFWKGEDLKGKTILIYGEQGFGDTILCSRYIPMVKIRGARVILECKKALHNLFSDIHGIDQIGEYGEIKESFDYQIPIMSLPKILGTDLNTIPPTPHLHVPDAVPPLSRKLLDAGGEKLKVGIVWSGSVTFKGNKKRAVSVDQFIPLAKIPGVQLYSLQKGPCEKELYDAGADALIWDLSGDLNDFTDTAAIINELDLVVMTDSSVAHLAGSIGCPIWNLLNFRPYWLYLTHREDSPWYPSMRLFRQPEPGDWGTVFNKVSTELEKAVIMKKSGTWKTSKNSISSTLHKAA